MRSFKYESWLADWKHWIKIVSSILGDNDLRSAFIEERICIRTTNVVFTTSFVAHDLFGRPALLAKGSIN